MFRASFAIILIAFWVPSSFSQQPVDRDSIPTCRFSEVFRQDGWAIPGVRGAKVKSRRAALGNMPGVFVTALEPGEAESNMTEIKCHPGQGGRLEIVDLPIRILDLWSFDLGGRVFAYRISYEKETTQNSVRLALGAASSVIFYDMDGSGRFTVRRGAGYFPELTPEWVKNHADAASPK